MSEEQYAATVSRRKFLGAGSAIVAAAAGIGSAQAQENQSKDEPIIRTPDHHLPSESEPAVKNTALDEQNPNSVWSPATDAGGQPPFKYPFSLSHKRMESGGWTRQVTVRDLAISKKMAGVQMRLIKGGVRELHWHVGAEWALMLYGSAQSAHSHRGHRSYSTLHMFYPTVRLFRRKDEGFQRKCQWLEVAGVAQNQQCFSRQPHLPSFLLRAMASCTTSGCPKP